MRVGKCQGCKRVWGAAGSEGQCSRCHRCLDCCSRPEVERSCVAKELSLSPLARERSNAARERYHDNPNVLTGHRGKFER